MDEPKLRNASKFKVAYPIGRFPPKTILKIGAAIVYLLHTRGEARLEGQDWERIFAGAIGADHKPSNVGLDDVVLDNCCWGAKTVKSTNPITAKAVRLISGRNSLDYSFSESDVRKLKPTEVGKRVLDIWNHRVSTVRQTFPDVRTVVLIKGPELLENVVLEFKTVLYDEEVYNWSWNANKNLEGFDSDGHHCFTWQPHGSQFTIVEKVPESRVAFRVRKPTVLSEITALSNIGFDEGWVTII